MNERKIDLSGLPRWENGKNKGSINWKASMGCKCKFVYDDIEDEVEIIGYKRINNKSNLIFKYGDKIDEMPTDKFAKCRFGKILCKITSEFKIGIGEVFEDKKRNMIITDRKYKKDKKGQNWKFYKYHCNKCGWTEGWVEESCLLRGGGCACCRNSPRVVVPGINDIVTTDNWMVKFFQGGEEEARLYNKSSNKKIYPICPDCGKIREKPISINKIYSRKHVPCNCNDNTTYPEKFMSNILFQLGVEFEYQLSKANFTWCENYKYDFYLKDYDTIIETHGRQHYDDVKGYMKKIKDEQYNDLIKKELALKNGILNYIVIDCRLSDIEWIKDSISNSVLYKIFDFSNINWNKAHEFALSNLVKEVCEYYENNKDSMLIKDIAKVFKIGRNATSRYLKFGSTLGWCNYDINKIINTKYNIIKPYNIRKVLCVELNEEFESMTECSKQLNKRFGKKITHSGISDVCTGKLKSHQGFTFKYV